MKGKDSKDDLRLRAGNMTPEEWREEAARRQLAHFRRTNSRCGVCGAPMREGTPLSLVCTECGEEVFPKLSPAIVVLVTRGDKALLVHARNFKGGMHALVAGFVEPGETLEECVAREVREETTLEVEDVRYVGSQSWPFPSQMMVGFRARWKEGEIRFADGELTSGGWFGRDALPELPRPGSLSRRIIDDWIRNLG